MKMRPKTLIAVLAVIVISCIALTIILFFIPQIRIGELIHIPPAAQQIYQTESRYGANAAIRNVYYLIDSSPSELDDWYRNFYPDFQAGNPAQDWLITAKASDAGALNTIEASVLGHETLCNYQYTYSCVTISMIDLSVHRPLELPISSAGNFAPDENSELYKLLGTVPDWGTLIIYKYFIHNF